jgi:hypothetical protein
MMPDQNTAASRPVSVSRILRLALLNAVVLGCVVVIPLACQHIAAARRAADARRAAADEHRALAAREYAQRQTLAPCRSDDSFRTERLAALHIEPGKVRLAAVVAPAFEPEYAIAVEKDAPGDVARIVRLDRSYWYAVGLPAASNEPPPTAEPVSAKITLRQLDRAIIDRLEQAWAASVAHATAEPRFGFDGVTYEFITPEGCGVVWVPESGTRPAQLAELVEGVARGGSDAELARMLTELTPVRRRPGQAPSP